MLDLRFICENLDNVEKNLMLRANAEDIQNLNQIAFLNEQRKKIILKVENLRSRQNTVSKEIAQMKQGKEDSAEKMKEMKSVSDESKGLSRTLFDVEEKIQNLMLTLPNLLHETVPAGKDEADNVEVRRWGKIPKFDFTPKDHQEIGERLDIIDIKRAAKISGARFTIYKNLGAKLERALINFMLDIHTKESGYQEVLPPFLVNRHAMIGTGQLPKFGNEAFKIENSDYFLIPTSEVPLCNIYRDEILDGKMLPISLTAYSPCFRKEAGSYGKDVRGLIRQHQFNKVELVKIVEPKSSYTELETLTADAEKILQKLELPYRVVLLCSTDTGFSAAKTYDIEVWLPSQNRYREISSCSNCEDFQSHRMNLRYRSNEKAKPAYPHTLNGSGLAVGRTLIAILENFQKKDGTVQLPKVLQSYVGAKVIGF